MLDAVSIQVLALLTAAAATTSAGAAVATLRAVYRTRRAVFGEAAVDHDNGLIGKISEHEERLDEHEAVFISMGEMTVTDGGERIETDGEATTVADIELPDAAEESGTERDGLLSYAGEWHALLVGLGIGMVGVMADRPGLLVAVATAAVGIEAGKQAGETEAVPALGEVASEPWYALAGLLAGACIGLVVGVIAL